MSTTLDARLAALKDGDTVRLKGHVNNTYEFLAVREGRIVLWRNNDVSGYSLDVKADEIVLPDPPLAKPGVVYRHKEMGAAIGLVSGQLRTVCPALAGGGHSLIVNVPMSADWIEVPDEQEGR